ncbi:hypothetical protein IE53DRAFT_390809 [Violaceomyces palustris]|uniref:Uncharacterized protein n=1 Tax=Violaceomyces palustris TaxID=1673888 RepID=A0ACD0NMQ6_9BASI|nr:hypothetical protein IE53DRAFT_390809 [Violaceomyces palustris]
MAKVSQPELKKYLDKKVAVNIQGNRKIQGTLRGFDIFLNLVIDDAVEQVHPETGNTSLWKDGASCGTVVSLSVERAKEGLVLFLSLLLVFLELNPPHLSLSPFPPLHFHCAPHSINR